MSNQRFCSVLPRVLLFASLLLSAAALSAQPTPVIAPTDDWIEPAAVPALRSDEPSTGGIALLLVDEQVRVEEGSHAHYVHAARGLVNAQGVASASQLAVTYDPSYQRLTFHGLAIRRGDKVIDQLGPDRIEMLRREPGLEAQLYDGNVTASLLLDDVRTGDVIEYAYTLEGANPILGGRYYGGFDLGWSVPVREAQYRLLWPAGRTLHVVPHRTAQEPERRERGNIVEYRWADSDIEAVQYEDGVPYWYNPYPWVQLSEAGSWAEVAAWGDRLFAGQRGMSRALRPVVDAIADSADTPSERIEAALRFAQDEIRYTGLEMGVGSHRPRSPAEVLRTRFGDCKDKALLLETMLEALGIEADVALVSTAFGRGLETLHPSPYAFDHAIVRVRTGGSDYWLDPTALHQRGTLSALTQADYDLALLLRPGTSGLTPIKPPRPSVPDRRISETLDVSAGPDAPATYAVTTTYVGDAADGMRARLSRRPISEMTEDYLNFYAASFPGIELAEPIRVDDDETLNWLIVDERYTVPNAWVEKEGRLTLSLFATETSSLFETPQTRRRTMPLRVDHPFHQRHRIEVLLHEPWPVQEERKEVENDAFAFSFASSANGPMVTLEYEYLTKADHVTAEASQDYVQDVEDAHALVGYELYGAADGAGGGALNWPILLLTLGFAAGAVFAVRRVYRWEPSDSPVDPALTDQTLDGIGGWLYLVAVQLILTPFVLLFQLRELLPLFDAATWALVTQSGSAMYHPLLEPVLLMELALNTVWFAFSLLLPILFFQRRRSFPRIYIAYLITTFLFVALDMLATLAIPTVATGAQDVKAVTRAGLSATLWSLYFLKSDRVEATFTETRGATALPVTTAANSASPPSSTQHYG